MADLTIQQISDLELAGFHVSTFMDNLYVEGDGFIAEQEFGFWYLYDSSNEPFQYIDRFESFDELYSYYKDNK